MEKLSRKIYY